MKCNYDDCGWCYAPDYTQNNSQNGQCNKPRDCPHLTKQTYSFYNCLVKQQKEQEND